MQSPGLKQKHAQPWPEAKEKVIMHSPGLEAKKKAQPWPGAKKGHDAQSWPGAKKYIAMA